MWKPCTFFRDAVTAPLSAITNTNRALNVDPRLARAAEPPFTTLFASAQTLAVPLFQRAPSSVAQLSRVLPPSGPTTSSAQPQAQRLHQRKGTCFSCRSGRGDERLCDYALRFCRCVLKNRSIRAPPPESTTPEAITPDTSALPFVAACSTATAAWSGASTDRAPPP